VEGTETPEKLIRALLGGQTLAVLATATTGAPHTSLVGFCAPEGLCRLVFVTGRATRKYGHLQRDGRASMLIDNRTHKASDFRLAMALTAVGKVRELTGDDRSRPLAAYLERFPYLQEFACSPGTALMALEVERYSLVRRFQDVVELVI
jgi:hypothetical protein